MDPEATFAPQSVLGPRRSGWNRLGIVVPVLALVAALWAGASGAGSDRESAESPHAVAVASPSIDVVPSPAIVVPPGAVRYPAQVIGLDVHRLDEVQARGLRRDTPIAVAGWYALTEIADCPPLAAIYRAASLPDIRGDADEWAFCMRSGILYASRPNVDLRVGKDDLQ